MIWDVATAERLKEPRNHRVTTGRESRVILRDDGKAESPYGKLVFDTLEIVSNLKKLWTP